MTLSEATAVGFAVSGGAPTDARQWITVDMAGFPGSERRGYIVATEPMVRSWHGIDLASQAREIILTELRRLRHLSPEEALGRSLAAANGIVVSRNQEVALEGRLDDVSQVGVSAIVFEDNLATIAHVPPGQIILVEDGLVYSVPEFRSWFPDYFEEDEQRGHPEPLGYATWTAPLMAQTEVRAGDTIILCTAGLGQWFVEDAVESGMTEQDLAWMHHRDPDKVLDYFKDTVIAAELPSAATTVVSFPPLPSVAEIRTLADVRRRARDTVMRTRSMVRQLRPAGAEREIVHEPDGISAASDTVPEPFAQMPQVPEVGGGEAATPRTDFQERVQRLFEPKPSPNERWRPRPEIAQFGVPGAHGVSLYRSQSASAVGEGWRRRLPRLPIIGSAWIWPLLGLFAVGLVLGALWMRTELLGTQLDPDEALAGIDQQILQAREASASADALRFLTEAQEQINDAEKAGVDPELLDPRQYTVTEMVDAETNVIRMSDVQRLGSLPEEFADTTIQGVDTPAGVFFVAGSLYQYRPSETNAVPELVEILAQGERIGDATVGALWGVAFDAQGLYATDGDTVFMLPVESQEWRAVPLGRINNQPWKPGPLAAFDGSIYLLQAEYRQIYRFSIASSTGTAQPIDWLLTGARDSADDATDIAIDGNIYMLIDDGTMQLLRLGDRKDSVKPEYVGDDRAVSLVGRSGTGYLYQAVISDNVEDSRIVAFDVTGDHAVQLKLPIGYSTGDANVAEPFDGIHDIIVEESTGTIYIINRDGIWTARYSLPELPDEPEPTAEPNGDEDTESQPGATPTADVDAEG